jgi:hypothetical protein
MVLRVFAWDNPSDYDEEIKCQWIYQIYVICIFPKRYFLFFDVLRHPWSRTNTHSSINSLKNDVATANLNPNNFVEKINSINNL